MGDSTALRGVRSDPQSVMDSKVVSHEDESEFRFGPNTGPSVIGGGDVGRLEASTDMFEGVAVGLPVTASDVSG